MRKIAGTKTLRERGGQVDRMGDLIELEVNNEGGTTQPGGGSGANAPGAGKGESAEAVPAAMGIAPIASTSTTTATEEALLNERFPIRGRVRTAYVSSGTGKDKGD